MVKFLREQIAPSRKFKINLLRKKLHKGKENNEDFSRLIWISPDLNRRNERQKRFIETLKRDVEGQEGTEILQTLLEDFKNIIREELEDASEKKVLDERAVARSI